MPEKLTVVVPCFNEEAALPLLWDRLEKVANGLPDREIEAVFVDDGSVDATLSVIKGLKSAGIKTTFISFSRNFGKESALYAGLKTAALIASRPDAETVKGKASSDPFSQTVFTGFSTAFRA